MWRRQLLNNSSPIDVLRATHALAQLDGATDSPTVATMLRDHLQAQSNGEEPAEPGFDANERPPWWIGTVATHPDQGTLVELAHDLFWVINQLYVHPAVAYAEGTIEQPDVLVRNIKKIDARAASDSRPQLLLDAGALISTEAHPHGKVIAQRQLALLARRPALLPTVVFAQAWRVSPRQHVLSRIRQMCRALPFTAQTAEDVGRLLARSKTSDVVDAAVIEHNAAVLTSDPKDLATLASAADYPVRLLTI